MIASSNFSIVHMIQKNTWEDVLFFYSSKKKRLWIENGSLLRNTFLLPYFLKWWVPEPFKILALVSRFFFTWDKKNEAQKGVTSFTILWRQLDLFKWPQRYSIWSHFFKIRHFDSNSNPSASTRHPNTRLMSTALIKKEESGRWYNCHKRKRSASIIFAVFSST